jgi:2-desacetyl-2-hydroxyethyl bacteriochlorophyllide A dehydrogenase
MGMMIKQLMLVGKNQVELQDAEVASDDSAILVKNGYSLISPGTELALFTGTHIGFTDPEIAWARYPLRPGYASVGTVLAAGSGTKGFTVGDLVLHYQPHASHSVVRPGTDLVFHLPDGIDEQRALFARFGQIAYTAVAASNAENGYALVLGGGIVGNLAAQLFQARRGRKAIVVDLSSSRVALARKCGVEIPICSSQCDLRKTLQDATGGEGVTTVVEATGVPALVAESLDLVNRLGEVILLGSTRGQVELDVYKRIHRKAVTVIGAHESRYPLFGGSVVPAGQAPQASHDFFGTDVLHMIADGTIKLDGFITDTVLPADTGKAYDMLLSDKEAHLGIIIDWNQGRGSI